MRRATKGNDGVRLARLAKSRLERSFADRGAVRAVAGALGLSPRALGALFSAHFGRSPAEFVSRLRVRRARRLLEEGAPVERAASEAGYFDASHLSRHFKRAVGMTPGRYRAAQRGRPLG